MPNEVFYKFLGHLHAMVGSGDMEATLLEDGIEMTGGSEIANLSFVVVLEKPAGVQRKIRVRVEDLGLVEQE